MLGIVKEGEVTQQREREIEIERDDGAQKKEKGTLVSKSMVEEGHPKMGGCTHKKEGGNIKRRRIGLELEEVDCMLNIHKENLSKREMHIYNERSRRRKMAHMFSNAISLLPHANPKRDRCMILMDLICHIKALQNEVEEMGNKKQKLLLSSDDYHKENTNSNPNDDVKVEVNMSGDDLLITMNGTILKRKNPEKEKRKDKEACKKRISWSKILEALHDLEFEVVTNTLSTTFDSHVIMFIHAKILDMTRFKNKEHIEAILLQLFF